MLPLLTEVRPGRGGLERPPAATEKKTAVIVHCLTVILHHRHNIKASGILSVDIQLIFQYNP